MRWGVLGCAEIARKSVIPAILATDNNRLVAIASRKLFKAKEFAGQFHVEAIEGYTSLLLRDDIDAVYIPLPASLHFEWVIKSLNSGKHVLVEKPAGVSIVEVKLMVEKARLKNLFIMENFQFQYHSQHNYVKKLLMSNEIGEIRCFRSSFGFPPFSPETNIRYKKNLGGGALLDAGAYVIKAISFIMGNGFEVSSSFLQYNLQYDIDWYGGAFLINQEKGIFAEVAFGFDNYYQCNYEIWGSKGKITVERAFTAPPNFKPKIILEKQDFYDEIFIEKDNHFINLLKNFNEIVASHSFEKERINIIEQACLIEKVYLSANRLYNKLS